MGPHRTAGHHPVVEAHKRHRASHAQLRLADSSSNRTRGPGSRWSELRANTELTRAVHALALEIHGRVMEQRD